MVNQFSGCTRTPESFESHQRGSSETELQSDQFSRDVLIINWFVRLEAFDLRSFEGVMRDPAIEHRTSLALGAL